MANGHSPLDQFKIKYLTEAPDVFGYNLNFTNSSLFMAVAVVLICAFVVLAMRKKELVPGRFQSMAEMSYELIEDMINQTVGPDGRKYSSLIFSIFMFILFCNLLGMLPYSFTVTSHIAVTFSFALFVFLLLTVITFVRHGTKTIALFVPKGTPGWLIPLVFFVEVFAYLARPVSLSIRLAANMMAGHTMMKVIAGFVVPLGILAGWAPILLISAITGFEIFVAIIQAYIFTLLTCAYLNDAINLH